MKIRDMTENDIKAMADVSISRGAIHEKNTWFQFNYAVEHKGEVLAIGGIRIITPTTAWAWTDLSRNSTKHMIHIYRIISNWLTTLIEDNHLDRLQTYIEMDFPEAILWIEHLGFERESVMKKFLNGKDVYMYARTT